MAAPPRTLLSSVTTCCRQFAPTRLSVIRQKFAKHFYAVVATRFAPPWIRKPKLVRSRRSPRRSRSLTKVSAPRPSAWCSRVPETSWRWPKTGCGVPPASAALPTTTTSIAHTTAPLVCKLGQRSRSSPWRQLLKPASHHLNQFARRHRILSKGSLIARPAPHSDR